MERLERDPKGPKGGRDIARASWFLHSLSHAGADPNNNEQSGVSHPVLNSAWVDYYYM